MTMKATTLRPLPFLLAALLFFATACGSEEPVPDEHDHSAMADPAAPVDFTNGNVLMAEEQVQRYTCGMHPHIVSDEPGFCPICGMALTPIRETTSGDGIVQIDPVTLQNIGVRTASVVVAPLTRTIRTTGRFEMDEQGAYTATLKVAGWIEKLYVNYEGAIVRKGQPLLELYSPDLVSTQEEYLLALKNAERMAASTLSGTADDVQRLVKAARRRLSYWDLTPEQIEHLEKTGMPNRTLTFYAPASGEVMFKHVVEGQRIEAGQPLMQIFDTSHIWLIADIYEQDLAWVQTGMPATVTLPYQPGETFQGKVEHIYYMLDNQTRSARARIVLPGIRAKLKPGMYATVELQNVATTASPVVPEEAVLFTGEQAIVLVALGAGRFAPIEVHTGLQADGKIQVLHGLQGGEQVVTSAQFLIDSEARLKSAVGTMTGSHQHGEGGTALPQKATPIAPPAAGTPPKDALVDVYAADRDGDGNVNVCMARPHLLQDLEGQIPGCTGEQQVVSIGVAQAVLYDLRYTNVPVSVSYADKDGDGYVYQSAMHWTILHDEPGNCDICYMTLERFSVAEARQNLKREGFTVRE